MDLYRQEDRLEEVKVRLREAVWDGDGDAVVRLQARVVALHEAVLTSEARKKLAKSDFVFPEKAPGPGSYPIHDREHGGNALSRSSGKAEHGAVKAKVCRRYPDLPACKTD